MIPKLHALAAGAGIVRREIGQNYPGYEATNWYAFVAPGRTPKEIIERLNREIVRTLNTPETRDRFLSHGEEPSPSTPEELAKTIERELATWGRALAHPPQGSDRSGLVVKTALSKKP